MVARSHTLHLPLLRAWALWAALLASCGQVPAAQTPPPSESPAPGRPSAPRPLAPRGGVLALAGPDQRALPGMEVRLDARGSVRPEDGRPFTALWVQEEGPPVLLDDPTSLLTSFVAPARRADAPDRVILRLHLDDGSSISSDRVSILLVDDPAALLPAPIALGGADQEVRPGASVQLAVPPGDQPTWATPTFLDPACILEGGSLECAQRELLHCWTQVEGAAVELDEPCGSRPSFTAPHEEDVLTFRLDAQRESDRNRSSLCGPEGEPDGDRPFCAAADYLRVFVRRSAWRTSPPTSKINLPDDLSRPGMVVRIDRASDRYPEEVRLSATASDPISQQLNTYYGFRPLLGTPPLGESGSFELTLQREPSWPRIEGIAFEAQFRRLRAAPAVAVVAWLPPSDRPWLHADAGPTPCSDASEPWCAPIEAGEQVVLEGSSPGSPSPSNLSFCWEQVGGPRVRLTPPERCLVGQPTRSFEAPHLVEHSTVDLSFRLWVEDGGPLGSEPHMVLVPVRARGSSAPQVKFDVPQRLRPGIRAILDASPTTSERPPTIRWRLLEPQAGADLTPSRCDGGDAPPGACAAIIAGPEAAGSSVELEVLVTDSFGITSTRRLTLPVAP